MTGREVLSFITGIVVASAVFLTVFAYSTAAGTKRTFCHKGDLIAVHNNPNMTVITLTDHPECKGRK